MGDQATLSLLYSDSLQIQLIILHGNYHLIQYFHGIAYSWDVYLNTI